LSGLFFILPAKEGEGQQKQKIKVYNQKTKKAVFPAEGGLLE